MVFVSLAFTQCSLSQPSPAAWSHQTTCPPGQAPPCQPREPGKSGCRPSVRCPQSEGWSTGKEHTPTVNTNTETKLIWLQASGKGARKLESESLQFGASSWCNSTILTLYKRFICQTRKWSPSAAITWSVFMVFFIPQSSSIYRNAQFHYKLANCRDIYIYTYITVQQHKPPATVYIKSESGNLHWANKIKFLDRLSGLVIPKCAILSLFTKFNHAEN